MLDHMRFLHSSDCKQIRDTQTPVAHLGEFGYLRLKGRRGLGHTTAIIDLCKTLRNTERVVVASPISKQHDLLRHALSAKNLGVTPGQAPVVCRAERIEDLVMEVQKAHATVVIIDNASLVTDLERILFNVFFPAFAASGGLAVIALG